MKRHAIAYTEGISAEFMRLWSTVLSESLQAGDRIRLASMPPYFKTAEPLPMLRPPNVVQLHEEGTILGREPSGLWQVRFNRGAYLLDAKYIEPLQSPEADGESASDPEAPPTASVEG